MTAGDQVSASAGAAVEARSTSAGATRTRALAPRPRPPLDRGREQAARGGGDLGQAPVDARQRRRDDLRDRVVVVAGHRQVARDVQALRGGGRVDAAGDRVRQAEHGGRARLAGEQRGRGLGRGLDGVARVDHRGRQPELRAHLRYDPLRRAVRRRRPARGEHGHAPVAERVQVLEHERDAAPVVEQHLAHGRTGQRVADRHHRQGRADLLPARVGRVQRGDHEAVDELVGELAGQHPLALGLPAGVDDDHVQLVAAELAAQHLHEALLAEILQGTGEDADQPRAAAGQRAGDRVARVAELVRRPAHPLLGLGRRLNPAQRIRHGGGRQAGRCGDVAECDASARDHLATPYRLSFAVPTAGRLCLCAPPSYTVLKRFTESVQ